MSELVPYQEGMQLGRLFDLGAYSTGHAIFPPKAYQEPVVEENPSVVTSYMVANCRTDIREFLRIPADLSLKVKSKTLVDNVTPSCQYLSGEVYDPNKIMILAKCRVETVTEMINDDLDPVAGWADIISACSFIRSIVYGGELLACVTIQSDDITHIQDLLRRLDLELGTIYDISAQNSLHALASHLSSNLQIEVEYFSTLLTTNMPQDMDGLLNILDRFPQQVKAIDKKGNPLVCEIIPITILRPDCRARSRVPALNYLLDSFEEYYDDIRLAFAHLERFQWESITITDPRYNEKLKNVNAMKELLTAFKDIISSLDVTSTQQVTAVNKVLLQYREKSPHLGFGKYVEMMTDIPKLEQGKPLTLVLLGKTGYGKSSTGNLILGKDVFMTGDSSERTTTTIQRETAMMNGREVTVIDTPGIVDTTTASRADLKEIAQLDGIDAYVIVWRYPSKMTFEDTNMFKLICESFGHKALTTHGILLLTHGDSFPKESFVKYIEKQMDDWKASMPELKEVVQAISKHSVLFDNFDHSRREEQVIKLLNFIHVMSEKNENNSKDEKVESLQENKTKCKCSTWCGWCRCCRCCFPETAIVTRYPHGHTIPICEVRVGDRLLSTDSSGDVSYQEVYMIGHADPGATMSAVSVSTKSSRLTASTGHFIFTGGETAGVDWRATKLMEDIGVGDKLLVYDPISEKMVQEEVQSVQRTEARGMYNPMTLGGTLLVDNILATCYERHVTPRYAHPLLWPIRMLYKVKPGWLDAINTHREEGIPIWALKFCQNIPSYFSNSNLL